jgi:hypothetical protein
MIVSLVGLDNTVVEPGEIPPGRAFPRALVMPNVGGCGRIFLRRGDATGDGVYDEVEPVEVKLLKDKIGSGGQR